MTLDEAIEQYKHIANSYESVGNTDDAMETRQIAEWLRQARGADKANRYYTVKIRELEAENAKLRELARHLRECTRRNSCAECEYADDACDFDYDMRELGIEYEER